MKLFKEELQKLDNKKRLNIINSITGIKPANLIATKSNNGQANAAIFSSVVHLGSNPALIGFIMRPTGEVPRHTYENIVENGCYTINHIHTGILAQAHYTSAKIDKSTSEFVRCGLTEEYIDDFYAPFVKESTLKFSLKFVEEIPIKLNNTLLIIGEIESLMIPDLALDENGYIDLALFNTAGISGLNSYYGLQKVATFPYARPNEIPNFSKK
ncbi:MAG: flavin reductase (DIM6/NTAB) family NADH-FMN oxidoreductase RutF [Cyclobacteriaceae bacterium]|jgi:flavin reductase (DIM6/NTAB) family NADH-FMN oxidoreductase RutF